MKINSLITVLLPLIGLISCSKDFLNVEPKGKLVAKTTTDYSLMLNSLTTLGNQYFHLNQEMGDEIAAMAPYFDGLPLNQQRSFRWEDNIYEPNEDADEISSPLKALYSYNIVINEVLNSVGGTEQEKNSIKAEALAGRAWTYFQLINFFGKPYDPTTAGTDPGFPIITKANVNLSNFKRASVKAVYEFIIEDLKEALPYLTPAPYHRFRMSRAAAEAILGKVYLFEGNFKDALQQLNASMKDLGSSTYPVRLYDYNIVFAPGGEFFPDPTFGPSLPNLYHNEEVIYARQTIGDATGYNNALLISAQTMALYDPNDMRLKFMSRSPFPSGSSFPLGMSQRLGPFAPIIGMVIPDLYLMCAEVKARLGDLEGAKVNIEALRVKRMPPREAKIPDSIASNRTSMVKFILEERIREFSGLGYRWFDMRRLSVDPEFKSTVNTTHTLYSSTGAVQSSFILQPERLTFKIPKKVLSQNPGMKDNP